MPTTVMVPASQGGDFWFRGLFSATKCRKYSTDQFCLTEYTADSIDIDQKDPDVRNNRVILHHKPSVERRLQTVNVVTAVTEYLKRRRDEAINEKVKLAWSGINN